MLPILIFITIFQISRSSSDHEPRVMGKSTSTPGNFDEFIRALAENYDRDEIRWRKEEEGIITQEKDAFMERNASQHVKCEAPEADDLSAEARTLLHSDGVSYPTENEKKLGKKLAHVNKLVKQQETELKGLEKAKEFFNSVREQEVLIYFRDILGHVRWCLEGNEEVAALQEEIDKHPVVVNMTSRLDIYRYRRWFAIFTVMSKNAGLMRNSRSDVIKNETMEDKREDYVYKVKDLSEKEGFNTGPENVQRNAAEVAAFAVKVYDGSYRDQSITDFKNEDNVMDALRLWKFSLDVEKFARVVYRLYRQYLSSPFPKTPKSLF